ncbi:MAG: hypothetical protein KAJ19_24640 [Gammaproteobacteria bacterium]|nr:hypothetical protein [Gammaproteobacteria bacterium]
MAEVQSILSDTTDGMLIWTVVVAVFLGLYGFWRYREGDSREGVVAICSAIVIILLSWATDYYKGVWIGSTLLGVSIMMHFTSHDEGMIQELFYWTGAGLLIIAIFGYIIPITVPGGGGYSGYVIGVGLIGIMLFVDINLDRYTNSWELPTIFIVGVVGALLLNFMFGLDHAHHGLALMFVALAFAGLGVHTKLVDPVFIAGFLIFLDDIVGHGMGGDPRPDSLITLWVLLGFVGTGIYVIRRWSEE